MRVGRAASDGRRAYPIRPQAARCLREAPARTGRTPRGCRVRASCPGSGATSWTACGRRPDPARGSTCAWTWVRGPGCPGVVIAIACPGLGVDARGGSPPTAAFLTSWWSSWGWRTSRSIRPGRDPSDTVDVCLARAFASAGKSWQVAEPLLSPSGGSLLGRTVADLADVLGGTCVGTVPLFEWIGIRPPRRHPAGATASAPLRLRASSPRSLARSGPLVIMCRQ